MQLGMAKFEMRFGFFYLSLFILRLFTYCPSILSAFINDITIDDEETTFVVDDQDLKGDYTSKLYIQTENPRFHSQANKLSVWYN
jgi:hypothetical protein